MLRLSWRLRLLCLSLFSVVPCACTQTLPATQVLVAVHAESEQLASELSALKAQLFPLGATRDSEAIESRNFALTTGPAGSGRVALPFSFGIEKGEASRFLLVITGYRRGETEAVIEHKLIASFQARQTVLVEVVLTAACYERASLCASLDQTCDPDSSREPEAGSCGPVREAATRPISPGQEFDATTGSMAPDRDGGDADDASEREDAESDTGAAEASDAAAEPTPAALGRAGTPCETPDALACDKHNGRQKLVCFKGEWSPNGSCDGDTRCQTRRDSPAVGTCLPIAAGCTGKSPGDAVCEGSARRSCGVDLLDLLDNACPVHASCGEQAGAARCSCDAQYMDDGAGACVSQYCVAMPCQNGGLCNARGAGRSCDCNAVDYEGNSCETKIDDCARTPCAPYQICSDGVRARTCSCKLGFSGATCNVVDPLEVAYVGETPEDLRQFEQWLGRPLDGVLVHTSGSTWTEYESTRSARVARWGTIDRRVFWSIALLVPGTTLAEAGSGAYDEHYRAAAQALANTRLKDAEIVVVTGWAFNIDSTLWSARGKSAEFIAAYRRFVNVFRSVSSRFVFEWGMALGDLGMDPATAYPGDEYVDLIGMNLYYSTKYLPTDGATAWDIVLTQKWGLTWHQEFAAAHQKRTAYSEWGVDTDSAAPFIQQAKLWFESHPVLFHAYWNADGSERRKLSDNQYPDAGAAYKAAFGH